MGLEALQEKTGESASSLFQVKMRKRKKESEGSVLGWVLLESRGNFTIRHLHFYPRSQRNRLLLIGEEAVINKMKVCTLKSLLAVKLFYCIL